MSYLDIETALDDVVLCPECGDELDAENVSVGAFEDTGSLVCCDCWDAECEE